VRKSDYILGGFLLLILAVAGAYYWVLGRDQFMLFLRLNNYEIKATFIFIVTYVGVRLFNHSASAHLSYLAVFSGVNVALNPHVIHGVLMGLHSHDVVGRGDEKLRSFAAGLLSFVCGIVALVRILRSHGSLRGLPFAIAGAIGGAIWTGLWAVIFIRFVSAMARW
jgi:hypothetical protein